MKAVVVNIVLRFRGGKDSSSPHLPSCLQQHAQQRAAHLVDISEQQVRAIYNEAREHDDTVVPPTLRTKGKHACFGKQNRFDFSLNHH